MTSFASRRDIIRVTAAAAAALAPTLAHASKAAGISVLVVDDYATMRRIINNLLRQIGFQHIEEATDGQDALSKLRSRPVFGLVISDWTLEPMTGLDLLKEIRADARLKSVPFLMVTSESKTDNMIAAKRAGANAYLVKPFNAATLKQKIEEVLGSLEQGGPSLRLQPLHA